MSELPELPAEWVGHRPDEEIDHASVRCGRDWDVLLDIEGYCRIAVYLVAGVADDDWSSEVEIRCFQGHPDPVGYVYGVYADLLDSLVSLAADANTVPKPEEVLQALQWCCAAVSRHEMKRIRASEEATDGAA